MPLARGEIRSCFAMTEPDYPRLEPGLDGNAGGPRRRRLRHRRPQMVRLRGRRGRFAIVMAVTDPEAEPHRRASMIVVPTDTPGFRRVRNISCMGHAGDDWASHAELAFERCRVPVREPARRGGGRVRHGPGAARSRADPSRDALDRRLPPCLRADVRPGRRARSSHRETRSAAGRPCKDWIAESLAEIEAARLLVLHAAWTIDTRGIDAAREAISLIKFHVAGVMQQVVDRAIQVHGALGISDDTVLSWFYRQERAARIYDGPDEVHKAVVAKRILKRQGLATLSRRARRRPTMSFAIDEAGPVRDGEQLDVARLRGLPGGPPARRRRPARRASSSPTGIRTSPT